MIKRRLLSLIAAIALIVQTSMPVLAYTPTLPGTASSVVNAAEEYVGITGLDNVREEMKTRGFKMYYGALLNNWCGWFVTNCGRQAGAEIGKGLIVNSFAYSAVNAGGKITFVNKTFYKAKKSNFRTNYSYNANYKPRKGDIIIYSSDGRYWWSHMGIVSANCSYPRKNVKTIEGNTRSSDYMTAKVGSYTRNSIKKFYIVAYITPKYKTSNCVYYTGLSDMTLSYTGYSTRVTNTIPEKDGYVFKGWKLKRLADGHTFTKLFKPGEKFTIGKNYRGTYKGDRNFRMIPIWEEAPEEITEPETEPGTEDVIQNPEDNQDTPEIKPEENNQDNEGGSDNSGNAGNPENENQNSDKPENDVADKIGGSESGEE